MEINLNEITPLDFELGGLAKTYVAGSGIDISDDNKISVVVDDETITINDNNQLVANYQNYHDDSKQDVLTAGENITIEDNVISAASDIFKAIYGTTTLSEIQTAFYDNKIIKLVDATHIYFLSALAINTVAKFTAIYDNVSYGVEVRPTGWARYTEPLQDKLISGTSIKTINNESLLGNGNINIDLSPYATEDYVDEQIADVRGDIPSLDGYATEDYVENYHDRTKQDTLTAGTNITIQNNVISATGGSSESDIFIATYNSTTYQEVLAAFNAGKTIFVKKTGSPTHMAMLTSKTNNEFWFGFIESYISAIYVNTYMIILRQNGWSEEFVQLSNESGTEYHAGDGIDIDGDTISAKVDGTTIKCNEDGYLEATGGGGQSAVFVEFKKSSYSDVEDCWSNDIPCYCNYYDCRYQLSYHEDNALYFSCSTLNAIKFICVDKDDVWHKESKQLATYSLYRDELSIDTKD